MTVSWVTAPPVPGSLVITDEPSAAISAIGNPGSHEVGDGTEPGEVAAGRLWPAFDDVPGGDRAGEGVVVVGAPTPPPGGGADDQ